MNRIISLIALFSVVVGIIPAANSFSVRHGTVTHHRQTTTTTSIRQSERNNDTPVQQERRSFLGNLALSIPMATLPMLTTSVTSANASGGATAGGAYLLSAKQRYNERVKASVQGLLQAADALKAEDSKPAKQYFDSEEGGGWKDLTAAGYLLSNAFRRNSTASPDSLPAVKVCD